MLLQFGIYVIFKLGVRFDTIDIFDKRGIKAMNLIAWPRAQFENNATSSFYERGNNGCVFKSDKTASYA